MGSTITEKIIAAHAGRETVTPGQLVEVDVDLALANDITAPVTINVFEKAGVETVWDPERIALVCDHFTPNKDIKSAQQVKQVAEFAARHQVKHFFDQGAVGVEHALLPEMGLVAPGELIIGADSHTCTYGGLGAFATGMGSTDLAGVFITGKTWLKVPESKKFVYNGALPEWVGGKDLILMTIGDIGVAGALYQAMEFAGPAIEQLSLEGRLTMANMAIEAGAKNGIIAVDQTTRDYVDPRVNREYTAQASDPDAAYAETRVYDVTNMEPVVAKPHLPENTAPVSELKNVRIDQAIIGSCTNGRIEDLRLAARVLKGRKVARGVRLIVIPATPVIWRMAMDEGLFAIFMDAGAVISPPTCGPCLGGHMGIMADGERTVATTNRNFVGRMGHTASEVYLANPAVAAASAVTGFITGPAGL